MQTTINESISRIRRSVKTVHQDAFMTDRYIFSLIKKYAHPAMKRLDEKNRLMGFSSIFRTLGCVELIEVDRIESGCAGIKTGIKMMRTKDKMNIFLQGFWGPLIRTVSSIDGMEELQPTTPSTYLQLSASKNHKYNKTKYYWYLNDYLYFPDINWPSVRVEGVLIGDGGIEPCDVIQDRPLSIPEHLITDIEAAVLNEIMGTTKIPSDGLRDNQNISR